MTDEEPLEFDAEGTLSEKPVRTPYAGWDVDPLDAFDDDPAPARSALVTLLVRVVLVVVVLIIIALLATPRSAAVIPSSVVVSPHFGPLGEADRQPTGAPREPQHWLVGGRTGAGGPNALHIAGTDRGAPIIPAAVRSAQATYCKPTPTHCQSWGGDAKVAAVFSFRFGDRPYKVRVHRGDAHVDVLVVSHCECAGRDDLIDLSASAFLELAPLRLGRIEVTIEDLRTIASEPLPPTDAE